METDNSIDESLFTDPKLNPFEYHADWRKDDLLQGCPNALAERSMSS
jgi:hypothetical protein